MTETLEQRLEYRIQSLQTYGVADQSYLILIGDLSDAISALRKKDEEIARTTKLAIEAINTAGEHHKQWFLEEIANVEQDRRGGVAP